MFGEWLAKLRDARAQAKIAIRIDRVTTGKFGDCKVLRDGVYCDARTNFCTAPCRWQHTQTVLGHRAGARYLEDYRNRTKTIRRRKASISHDEALIRQLRDNPDFAVEYLKAALEGDSEPRVLSIGLRRVVQAGGIAKIAKTAGVERENFYRALSTRGNSRLSTLAAVTKAVELRPTVEAAR